MLVGPKNHVLVKSFNQDEENIKAVKEIHWHSLKQDKRGTGQGSRN